MSENELEVDLHVRYGAVNAVMKRDEWLEFLYLLREYLGLDRDRIELDTTIDLRDSNLLQEIGLLKQQRPDAIGEEFTTGEPPVKWPTNTTSEEDGPG